MGEIITDEEWKRFLDSVYKNVKFDKPSKYVTEQFLKWRNKQPK